MNKCKTKLKLGVFVYTKDSDIIGKYTYLQDIQLTRYYEDGNKNPVTIGNAPTAISQDAHHYYLKPTTQVSDKEINTFGTLEALADELGADVNTITPVFNESSQKFYQYKLINQIILIYCKIYVKNLNVG